MAKFTLTLHKVIEVDTSTWSKAGEDFLADGLKGDSRRNPSREDLHDSIRDGLDDDMESCGFDGGDIDSSDFIIEVIDSTLATQLDDPDPLDDDNDEAEDATENPTPPVTK